MNYWHIQLHPNDMSFEKDRIRKILEDTHYIGMGSDWNDNIINQFVNDLQNGDIVLVRHDGPLALVKVIGENEVTEEDHQKLDWFGNRRKVEILGWIEDYKATIGSNVDNIFSPITFAKANKSKFIKNWYSLYKKIKIMEDVQKLLKSNKNLILTGAPGVGKTYKTAEIAVAICDGVNNVPSKRQDLMKRYKELINEKQIAFTTFHQSLDYEEFVEGLKPDIDDDGKGNGTFSVKSGIFKNICEKAENAKVSGGVDNFDNAWNRLITKVANNLPTPTPIGTHDFILSNQNTLKFNSISAGTLTFNNIYNVYKGLDGRPCGAFQNYMQDVVNYMKSDCELRNYVAPTISQTNEIKNYVLIIDEINRGNISRIFGELITLLEKDKRLGEENEITVTLPYSQDSFGVPPNLYIIGTMNTADRSIGQIDYALRRRFAFMPLKAKKDVIDQNIKDQTTKDKALALFDAIKQFISDNINPDLDAEDLMVGHSYFLCETEDDLKQRLEYEIVPLLWEYQKDGILTCDKKPLKSEMEKWKNGTHYD